MKKNHHELEKKYQWLLFAGLMIAVIIMYFALLQVVQNKRIVEQIVDNNYFEDYSVRAEFNEIKNDNDKLLFIGSIYRLESEINKVYVVLIDSEKTNGIVLTSDVKIVEVPNGGFTGCSEFTSYVNETRIKKNVCYELWIVTSFKDESGLKNSTEIFSGKYVYDGEIYAYNPLVYTEPAVQNDQHKELIASAEICAYCLEHGVWIYTMKDEMHWIIEANKIDDEEGMVGIPWIIYTHHNDLLPDNMQKLSDSIGCVNRGFSITELEYFESTDFSYYYAKKEIPREYPIAHVETGIWLEKTKGSGWKCRNVFSISELERDEEK